MRINQFDGGYYALNNVTRGWFDRDLLLRSRLAVASARQLLVEHWWGGRALDATLADITRDERIMDKLDLTHRSELVEYALKFRLLG